MKSDTQMDMMFKSKLMDLQVKQEQKKKKKELIDFAKEVNYMLCYY